MKKHFLLLPTLILIWTLGASATARAFEPVIPDLPTLSSSSYLLMDYQTGAVIAEHNAAEKMGPASITKLMTAYIVYQALAEGIIALDDKVTVSPKARSAEGSRMFLEEGSEVTVEDLLRGVVIQSGNDASVALAERIAGEEEFFVAMMNDQARKMGMDNSHFMNAAGFTMEDHYMSARDIAILSRAIIRNFPEYYTMYSEKEFTYNDIEQYNRNRLLWRDPSVDGLKTGHTQASRYCLATSAQREDMRLIAVVLDAPSDKQRVADTERLLNYGFRFYKTLHVYEARESLQQVRVWGGEQDYVNVGVADDFYMTLPRYAKGQLQVEKTLQADLIAPIAADQNLGVIHVKLREGFSQTAPLIALEPVPEGGLFKRLVDGFIRLF